MIDFRHHIIRPLATAVLQPAAERYLKKPRIYRRYGLILLVPPGVFHPGLFFSSGVMAQWLREQNLSGKHLLDVGTGSGLLGLVAAQGGAITTLLDLSPRALLAAQSNAQRNSLHVRLLHSDGLHHIPAQSRFDWIIANPPWFADTAPDEAGLAWYAGPRLGWFYGFFADLSDKLRDDGRAVLVLAESADLDAIRALAATYGWRLEQRRRRRVAWEWQYILEVVAA